MEEKSRTSKLTRAVFVLYLAILIWAIVFKFATGPDTMPFRHDINLIPFKESVYADRSFRLSEVIANVLAFIPFGVCISIFRRKWTAGKRVLAGFLLSLAFEVCQFGFSLGLADVTDLMTNTLGTWAGVGIYSALGSAFGEKTERKAGMVLLMLEIIFFCLALVLYIGNR